jgi:hydrogenase expression/formation protein HypC
MCLAVPGEVLSLEGKLAMVSVEGAVREVNVSLADDVAVGDYVLVHAGFALQRWTREEYLEWREIMSQLPDFLS